MTVSWKARSRRSNPDNVATIVVEKLNLTEDPEFQARPSLLQKLISYFSADDTPPSRSDLIQTAVDTLDKDLLVTRLSRSYVAQVSFTSLSRTKAIAIANAVTDAYIEDQLQAKSEVAKRASVWLQERTADLRSLATSALKDVQDFKSGNNLVIGADGKISTDLSSKNSPTRSRRPGRQPRELNLDNPRSKRRFPLRTSKG